jgi:hypothetical protein
MFCSCEPHDCGRTISAIPDGAEEVELGEPLDGGGDSNPRDPWSFDDGLWRKTVGGDRGLEFAGRHG